MTDVSVEAVVYLVDAPQPSAGGQASPVRVEKKSDEDLWAVYAGGMVSGVDGDLSVEPAESDQTEAWRRDHWFPRDQALAIAKELRIEGWD